MRVCLRVCRLGAPGERRISEEADFCQHEEKSARTNTVNNKYLYAMIEGISSILIPNEKKLIFPVHAGACVSVFLLFTRI